MWLLLCTVLAVATAAVHRGSCGCDANSSVPSLLLGCGTDGATHLLGPDSVSCLFRCNVGIQYAGACGCPNGCGQAFARGLCQAGACRCWDGWQGADCNAPSTSNACHGRGAPLLAPVTQQAVCDCDPGFTGRECFGAVHVPPLPYGYLTSRSPCATDPFCAAAHPAFNLSSVAVLHLRMDAQALAYLLTPANRLNGTYVDGVNVTFVQSGVVSSFAGGAVKVGGSYSKTFAKKGFLVKGNMSLLFAYGGHFGSKPLGVKKIKTKAGVNDASYLNSVLATDLYRALGSPVPRASLVQLTLNGVDEGVSVLYEEVERPFLDAWFGGHDGNLYKCDADLTFRGSDPAAYAGPYEQASGSGNWADFVALVTAIHNNDAAALQAMFDVDAFLRSQAVEALFADGDGFGCSGHNYYLYNNVSAAGQTPYFTFFRHDLDDAFGLKENDTPCKTKAVSYWAQLNLTTWGQSVCGHSPLSQLVFSVPQWRAQFLVYAQLLAAKAVRSGALMARIDLLFSVYAPYMAQDALYPLDNFGCGGLDFWYGLRNAQFRAYLDERMKTL